MLGETINGEARVCAQRVNHIPQYAIQQKQGIVFDLSLLI